MLLKTNRFGNLRCNTFSWCRRTRISACKAARDRNSPTKAHQSNLHISLIQKSINQFATDRQPYWVCGKDNPDYSEHGYFLAVETAFKQWEAMQNVGHAERPSQSGQNDGRP